TPSGSVTSTADFTVGAAPMITGFNPATGPVGSTVTINGSAFTGARAVSFNSTAAASFNVVSDTQINAIVPAGATSGPISITTATGTATTSVRFLVSTATLSGFSPTSGTVGATINIFGTSFTGASAVKFNNTPAA